MTESNLHALPASPANLTTTEKITNVTGALTVPDNLPLSSFQATRIIMSPTAWRLARRNGELILQAGSCWVQGTESGREWSDVPIVNLDETEAHQ